MAHQWQQQKNGLEKSVEAYLLEVPIGASEEATSVLSPGEERDEPLGLPPEPQVLALSRKKLNLETPPTGKRLEAIKQMMLRVHRASGHPGMSNLVQLLKARGSPGWALEIASNLEWQGGLETKTQTSGKPGRDSSSL